jgi:hypothetical protein
MKEHATKKKGCGCGGSCGSCAPKSELRRTAINNAPRGDEDALHRPMLEEMRREQGLSEPPDGPSDAELKYGCAPGNKKPWMSATVQPVLIAQDDGSNPTAAPSFTQVTDLWSRCCIGVTVAAPVTINRTAFQILDDTGPGPLTQEESDAVAAGPAGTQINVMSIRNFSVNGTLNPNSRGGGTTVTGTARPTVILVEGAVPEVVAHEVGHGLGHINHDAAATVMRPSGSRTAANPAHVSPSVCAAARTGLVLTSSGTSCCMHPN